MLQNKEQCHLANKLKKDTFFLKKENEGPISDTASFFISR